MCYEDNPREYAVDLARWQYREDAGDAEDMNEEWEPKDGG